MNIESYEANPKVKMLFPLIQTLRVDARTISNPELEWDAPTFRQLRLAAEKCSEQEAEALIPVMGSAITALRVKDAIEIGQKLRKTRAEPADPLSLGKSRLCTLSIRLAV